ncbi:retrotransposon protein [Cucumis melo var. makuwa]|uniref:Retrotransposon protein n=1 Tax=Cucumis melo var. makuwa TaxID=1194695 RepID=A0A5A7VM60_CUCMM|nr:retrotransposon protein [Cucumis melo var. makuwa]TYJ97163.1 retrotransposon protein [Cucumis melo var. makuwa]
MDRRTFAILCHLLRIVSGLSSTEIVDVEEMVAMFLHVLAHDVKNRVIQREFIQSGETVSRHFNLVLLAIVRLYEELIKRPVPMTNNCNDRSWKCFENCLGALDGTYIKVNVPATDRPTFRTRKGEIATNIYVIAGWEGSTADSQILRDALSQENGLQVPRDIIIYAMRVIKTRRGFWPRTKANGTIFKSGVVEEMRQQMLRSTSTRSTPWQGMSLSAPSVFLRVVGPFFVESPIIPCKSNVAPY